MDQQHATTARLEKAEKLASWLFAHGMNAEVAAAITPELWGQVAKAVGCRPPGEDGSTRLIVIGLMVQKECRRAERASSTLREIFG